MKYQKGFTLIELLIVVAILGVLASVIIPSVSAFMLTGELNAANTERLNVSTAVLAYYADNKEFPTNMSQLSSYITGNVRGTYTIDQDGLLTGTGGWERLAWEDGQWVKG